MGAHPLRRGTKCFRIASLLAAPDHPGSFVLAHQDQEAGTMEKKCMGSVEKVLGGRRMCPGAGGGL